MNLDRIPAQLYEQILKVMPIACVDLLVTNLKGEILLLKRKNDPAKGEWWFPGGRVWHGERRQDAVKRKLFEECGLAMKSIEEVGTFDVFLGLPESNVGSHGISTLFEVVVEEGMDFKIDHTSVAGEWRTKKEWGKENLHHIVRQMMEFNDTKNKCAPWK